MTVKRLPDYLDHMRLAIADAQSFTEGMAQLNFFQDKRTQQAVVSAVTLARMKQVFKSLAAA